MYHLHPDMAMQHARQRMAWLLEESEHDRLASQARAARRQRRQRRRMRLTVTARARQPLHEHAGAR